MLRLGTPLSLFLLGLAWAGSPGPLPVYIEDSHAGSFYWIVRNLPLNREYQMVLIDGHSDSSEILNSDSVRQAVLRAATEERAEQLAGAWRVQGQIQCFNWIEPLIPNPIAKVWWAPAETLTANQVALKRREVVRQIDAHESAWPRHEGGFGGRYEILDLNRLAKQEFPGPVVATLDLDFFASAASAEVAHARVERLLNLILKLPRLEALTIAISRPYLASEDQADSLLYEVLRYLTRVVNVDIQYEPFLGVGEDRSEKAKEFYRQRLQVPHYNIEEASPLVRSLILQNSSRISVGVQRARWEGVLARWRDDARVPRLVLSIDGHPVRNCEHALISAGAPFRLAIENAKSVAGTEIRWKAVVAANKECNLTGQRQGFADAASHYLRYRDVPVEAANGLTEIDGALLAPLLDRKTGLGTLRVYCEAGGGNQTCVSNVVSFSRFRGDGYVGKLTEIFNLPYVYGSAFIRVGASASADARFGADCSHFIIYGRRREGSLVPYVNPKDLLPYLEELDQARSLRDGIAYGFHGPIPVTPDLLNRGLLLHFGRHIAAVYADPNSRGLLQEDTPVVHQLGGVPEITTFGAMAARYKRIRVMTWGR